MVLETLEIGATGIAQGLLACRRDGHRARTKRTQKPDPHTFPTLLPSIAGTIDAIAASEGAFEVGGQLLDARKDGGFVEETGKLDGAVAGHLAAVGALRDDCVELALAPALYISARITRP